jgi:hypothetical protein
MCHIKLQNFVTNLVNAIIMLLPCRNWSLSSSTQYKSNKQNKRLLILMTPAITNEDLIRKKEFLITERRQCMFSKRCSGDTDSLCAIGILFIYVLTSEKCVV